MILHVYTLMLDSANKSTVGGNTVALKVTLGFTFIDIVLYCFFFF